MDSDLKQDTRLAELKTPLGKDKLVLVRFEGEEALSELFEYRVEAHSKDEVDYNGLLGRLSSVTIKEYGQERHFSGVVVEAQWIGKRHELHVHRLVLRPTLWLHTRQTDCRIFQEKTAPDIIKEVLSGLQMRWTLQENHPTLEYCVQYRETDFAFVSRLMEHHGIYYFFEHESDQHTVVFTDNMSSHQPVPGCASLPFLRFGSTEQRRQQHLYHWISERRFRTGKVELKDYWELTPNADMSAKKQGNASYSEAKKRELYDYPGRYKKKSEGEQHAKVVLDAEQALDERRYAAGNAVNLFPGGTTRVKAESHSSELRKADNNKEYLVVRASHLYVSEHYRSDMGLPEEDYSGNFELLPKEGKVFRAPLVTPRPRIYGIQTAVVTGPAGEEIWVDKYGRIKVQFHWDRLGKKDEQSSCWIRVAEVWSGKKWGGQFTPRIGMEAVVQFLEGDPDRPIVTGTVYNEEYRHPFDLPDNKTQSGWKSNSSKGGGGYNQIKFEDKKNLEEIDLHAQRHYKLKILDTETREIGEQFKRQIAGPNSRKTTLIQGDDDLTIASGNQTVTIAMSQTSTYGLNHSVTVGGSESNTIGASQTNTIGMSQTNTIGMSQMTMVGATVTIMASAGIILQSGASTVMINPAGVQIFAPTFAVVAPGGAAIKGATIPLVS